MISARTGPATAASAAFAVFALLVGAGSWMLRSPAPAWWPAPAPLLRLLLSLPIVGWMLRDALHGAPDAPLWGLATLVMLGVLAVIIGGYAALITIYLGLTALVLAAIIAVSRA